VASFSAGSPIDHDDVKRVVKETVVTSGGWTFLLLLPARANLLQLLNSPLKNGK
jgi:peptidase E